MEKIIVGAIKVSGRSILKVVNLGAGSEYHINAEMNHLQATTIIKDLICEDPDIKYIWIHTKMKKDMFGMLEADEIYISNEGVITRGKTYME